MANAILTALAKRLRELKDRKDVLAEGLKAVEAEIKDVAEVKLPAAMDDNEVERFTIEGVGSVYQQVKVYAYVKKDDTEKFHTWLRESGHGDLIRDYVFPQTLSSFAKELIEEGGEVPDFINAAKVPTAILRRK